MIKAAPFLLLALALPTCSREETSAIVNCKALSYENCQASEQCVWQFSDLDPSTGQIMSPSFCREL